MLNKKQIQTFIKANATLLIILISLLFFIYITLLIYYARIEGKDLGTVGDAFNGLIGPFIGLLSAILVYRSFVAQTEANERQTEATLDQIKTNKTIQSQWKYETYLSLFNDLKTSYNSIKVIVRPGGATEIPYAGEDAIKQYSTRAYIIPEDTKKLEKDLESVLRVTNYFFRKLKVVEIEERDIMLYIVIEFYQSYMQEALTRFRDKVIEDKRDTELGETLILISFCNQHYIELLELLQKKI